MAEESRNNRQSGKRRRYFRRKDGDRPQGESAPRPDAGEARPERSPRPERPARVERNARRPSHETGPVHERHSAHPGSHSGSHSGAQAGAAGGRANVRRRRRNKNRRSGDGRAEPAILPAAREPDYIPPTSVFIYTHIVRSSAQGYEFRAEHFSKVGRTLEEYDIDLSSLFDAEGRIQLSRVNLAALAALESDDDIAASPALPAALEQADVGEADDSRFDDARDLPTRDIDGPPDAPPIYGAEDTPPPFQDGEPDGPSLAVSE